ncbi:MAG: heme oxygenase [Candidatus Lambdaproteobacteria bacterium RIFOXYD1_FULL_56_27]|uniref:Heme oxygenase n=1 Tax=Candidatus Lambdaproteobacteria bacterium RIFOXYD2_FULL_56_26 TaxID=1817773 RepID=A0A1F6H2I9_9PROT|nr:MAG: heme oxygenase [Candidatus Lambdaproteobacteria bacterium RIFOXYC1_FULL_56_13]OGH04510.1 MAG: heme oxygenase [Candidatus Lambdaproteobacteria bacterium RIFOXYD2_FULL_56_26]OGH08339.1 MAG: heme oxygenase [Candidatus Lambdaproteobacteria bacterium RIFOXYD1_FULL_56_27]
MEFPFEKISPLRQQLKEHPVYRAIKTRAQLQLFMERHIYSVWDFMSLVKTIQGVIAPHGSPWSPGKNPLIQRFINEIVLEEETDQLPDGKGYLSHYEMYLNAMEEVGASTVTVRSFARMAKIKGFEVALREVEVPSASRGFMRTTFSFIQSGKPHQVAAAFALGREHIIPTMFRSLLAEMNCTQAEAPFFHYYLERHIKLDQDHHGPLSLATCLELCKEDQRYLKEAEEAAVQAITARIKFWDGVLADLDRLNQGAA